MEKFYTVSYLRHNATSKAWAYKTELGTTNKDEAEKKYHALLAEFIGGETFDHVCAYLTDSERNVLMSRMWERKETPQTEAE